MLLFSEYAITTVVNKAYTTPVQVLIKVFASYKVNNGLI